MEKYLAFISYRHTDPDRRISFFLRRKLENYHLPKSCPLPRKRTVFRDTDELPTSADLGSDIENALKESGYLIALCSENYIVSRWCMREIDLYLAMGRKDRILPVLVSGTPETAVPESIRDLPVAADVRSGSREDREKAVQQLLSRMTGSEASAFAAREKRFRLFAGGCTAAAFLAAVLGFAVYSMRTAARIEQGNIRVREASEQAEAAREEAVAQRNRAMLKNADYIAEQAYSAISENDQRKAVQLALSALPEDLHGEEPVSMEAVGALRLALSLPQYSYQLKNTQQTDFSITGYRAVYSAGLFLTGDPDAYRNVLNYDTGMLENASSIIIERDAIGNAWYEARRRGYSDSYVLVYPSVNSDYSWDCVCYGADSRMAFLSLASTDNEPVPVSLNDEPFYADHVVQDPWGDCYLAWLAEEVPGRERRTGLFSRSEAIAGLELSGVPVSVSFPPFWDMVAVVDEAGALGVFGSDDGKPLFQVPGSWSFVSFVEGRIHDSTLCAVPEDGMSFRLISPFTGAELMSVPVPSRILSVTASDAKHSLLALCEDGLRIYSLDSGRLLQEIPLPETPRFALWGGGLESLCTDDGTMIVALYDRRTELYALAPELNAGLSGSVPLFLNNYTKNILSVLYSLDGNTVYIQDYANRISAWDTRTGELKWANANNPDNSSGRPAAISQSADGKAVWRNVNLKGRERIDAETGESLYIVGDGIGSSLSVPSESPDGRIGVVIVRASDGSHLAAFDPETGKKLWLEENYSGDFFFSADSAELFCYCWKDAADLQSMELVYRRLDSGTGEILEEKNLFRLELYRDYTGSVYSPLIDMDARIAVLDGTGYDAAGQEIYTVWMVDLADGSLIRKETLDVQEADASFRGGVCCVAWTDPADQTVQYCRTLDPVTGWGETTDNRSEKGRRLMASVPVTFAGQECYVNLLYYDPGKLYRISDNALMIDADPYRSSVTGDEDIRMQVEGSSRGGSVCVFGTGISGRTSIMPLLIFGTDTDDLVKQARRFLEEQP